MKVDLLKGLSEEQIAKVKACKNQEELLDLAKREGIELTDEQLEAISGGAICGSDLKCKNSKCDGVGIGNDILKVAVYSNTVIYRCSKCGYEWTDYRK